MLGTGVVLDLQAQKRNSPVSPSELLKATLEECSKAAPVSPTLQEPRGLLIF